MSSHAAYCCVDGCEVSSSQANVSFFRCPLDPVRCNQWKQALGFTGQHKYAALTPEQGFNRIRICSLHFDDNSFTASRKRLIKTAVPSILPLEISIKDEGGIKSEPPSPPATGCASHSGEYSGGCLQPKVDSVVKSGFCNRTGVVQEFMKAPATGYATYSAQYPYGSIQPNVVSALKSNVWTQTGALQEFMEDAACQTAAYLSYNTPREEKFKKQITELRASLRSCQRASQKKTSLNLNNSLNLKNVLQFLQENYPPETATLIRSQLLVLDKKPKGARYSKEFKQFALTLYLLGPKAYKKLARSIRLPSHAIVGRMLRNWEISPGFNEFIFKILELRVPLMPDKAKDCILCIDKMTLKPNLFYNVSQDEIVGFENINAKRRNIATTALVVIARGISHNWKQPIAYFFTEKLTNVNDLKEVIFESIRKLKTMGLNVLAVTSDQSPRFYKFVKISLKLTVDTPYFYVDDSPVFYFFDIPLLLKATKNAFCNHNIIVDGEVTNKEYLNSAYQIDKTKKYRLAPNLTDEHISPHNFSKTNFKLASEVFSHSVVVAMQTYIEFEKLPIEATVTANFIENINKLFHILYSSNQDEAFNGTKEQKEFLTKMDKMFSNLKFSDLSRRDAANKLKFIYGWRLSISTILKLWEILARKNYSFLLTNHFSKDCLDKYFTQISNVSRGARNPTAMEFCRAFKKLFTLKILDETDGDNGLEDATDVLLTITPELLKKSEFLQINKNDKLKPILKVNTNDYSNLETHEGNGLISVGAYLLRTCLMEHSCDLCLNYCQGPFGGSTAPPDNFIKYLLKLENIFLTNFNETCILDNVGNTILAKISRVPFLHPCQDFPFEYLLNLYTRVRIYFTLKFANRKIKAQNISKENLELIILHSLHSNTFENTLS